VFLSVGILHFVFDFSLCVTWKVLSDVKTVGKKVERKVEWERRVFCGSCIGLKNSCEAEACETYRIIPNKGPPPNKRPPLLFTDC